MEQHVKISGLSFSIVLFAIFFILKVSGIISWSWWIVIMPLIVDVIIIVILLLSILTTNFTKRKGNNK